MENQLILTDTGQVTVTAHQAGDSRYAAAESVSQSIRVAKRPKTPVHYSLSGHVWQEEGILYQGEATVVLYRSEKPFRPLYTQKLEGNRVYRFDSLEAGTLRDWRAGARHCLLADLLGAGTICS